MTKVGLVALDGTKMAANASMQANRGKDAIDAEVEKIFAEAKAVDAAEDAEFGTNRGDEPPATLRGRADRRRRFKQAKQLLDQELEEQQRAHEAHLAERAAKEAERGKRLRGRKPKAPEDKTGRKEKKVNTTDPESKVMSTSNGFVQGYNAQAVANGQQVILAAEVTDEHNDKQQLHPMIDATEATLKEAVSTSVPESFSLTLATPPKRTSPASTTMTLTVTSPPATCATTPPRAPEDAGRCVRTPRWLRRWTVRCR
jgi:hypothetical protein